MVIKHMKKVHYLSWGKYKSKPLWDIILYLWELPISKRPETTKVGSAVGEKELLYTVGGNVDCSSPNGKWFLQILNIDLPYKSPILLIGIYPKNAETLSEGIYVFLH